jgi:non-canonical (house-cleaning) NTP pyrophosphatase
MNLTVCAIYNGKAFFHGTGPAFELPEDITGYVINDKMELDEAVKKSGLSDNPRIGYSQGIIGIMSKNVVTRRDYMIPAVQMAIISLIHET